ncbi:MAG: hypothetical protein ACREA9_05770 [Pyrinomonadaceae bacterium]
MMRNTLPPLASNDLFGVVADAAPKKPKSNKHKRYGETKAREHEEDAFTLNKSTARMEASILPVQPSHFRRIPPERAELFISRQLLIDSVNHRGNGIICCVTESARAEEERGSQDQP